MFWKLKRGWKCWFLKIGFIGSLVGKSWILRIETDICVRLAKCSDCKNTLQKPDSEDKVTMKESAGNTDNTHDPNQQSNMTKDNPNTSNDTNDVNKKNTQQS